VLERGKVLLACLSRGRGGVFDHPAAVPLYVLDTLLEQLLNGEPVSVNLGREPVAFGPDIVRGRSRSARGKTAGREPLRKRPWSAFTASTVRLSSSRTRAAVSASRCCSSTSSASISASAFQRFRGGLVERRASRSARMKSSDR